MRFIGGEGKVAMAAGAYSALSPGALKMQHSLCCSVSGPARASKVTCEFLGPLHLDLFGHSTALVHAQVGYQRTD